MGRALVPGSVVILPGSAWSDRFPWARTTSPSALSQDPCGRSGAHGRPWMNSSPTKRPSAMSLWRSSTVTRLSSSDAGSVPSSIARSRCWRDARSRSWRVPVPWCSRAHAVLQNGSPRRTDTSGSPPPHTAHASMPAKVSTRAPVTAARGAAEPRRLRPYPLRRVRASLSPAGVSHDVSHVAR